jgi:predicted dehydrogenase
MLEKILIVGLGSIGLRHLRLARELFPDACIGILRRKIGLSVPEHANYIFSSMDEALLFLPQIAIISNPATFHITTAIPLVKAGVHIMIEKPLSVSAEGVHDFLRLCKKYDVVVATGYNLRYIPSLQKFKSMLDDNIIGSIWSVRCEIGQFLPSWRPGSIYEKGVSAQLSLGGGALLELSHELDYLRWIFGEVDWLQAVLVKQSDLDIDVEDSAFITLCFCSKGSSKPLIASVNLDFIRQDTTRTCTVIGKCGSLRWDGVSGVVELYAADSCEWQEVYKYTTSRDESYINEWLNFTSCVEEMKEPFVTGVDGLKVLNIIDAVRLASSSGSRVDVNNNGDIK